MKLEGGHVRKGCWVLRGKGDRSPNLPAVPITLELQCRVLLGIRFTLCGASDFSNGRTSAFLFVGQDLDLALQHVLGRVLASDLSNLTNTQN